MLGIYICGTKATQGMHTLIIGSHLIFQYSNVVHMAFSYLNCLSTDYKICTTIDYCHRKGQRVTWEL